MQHVRKFTSMFVLLLFMAGCTAAPMEETTSEEENAL
jgi:hypothetical protein